mmetsp:Transcript_9477/g.21021  ORF Transcript_9477/g.21021 Transcript_9477/m.21021 type:complete len:243 (+) Transcript_9477:57-785(+)
MVKLATKSFAQPRPQKSHVRPCAPSTSSTCRRQRGLKRPGKMAFVQSTIKASRVRFSSGVSKQKAGSSTSAARRRAAMSFPSASEEPSSAPSATSAASAASRIAAATCSYSIRGRSFSARRSQSSLQVLCAFRMVATDCLVCGVFPAGRKTPLLATGVARAAATRLKGFGADPAKGAVALRSLTGCCATCGFPCGVAGPRMEAPWGAKGSEGTDCTEGTEGVALEDSAGSDITITGPSSGWS